MGCTPGHARRIPRASLRSQARQPASAEHAQHHRDRRGRGPGRRHQRPERSFRAAGIRGNRHIRAGRDARDADLLRGRCRHIHGCRRQYRAHHDPVRPQPTHPLPRLRTGAGEFRPPEAERCAQCRRRCGRISPGGIVRYARHDVDEHDGNQPGRSPADTWCRGGPAHDPGPGGAAGRLSRSRRGAACGEGRYPGRRAVHRRRPQGRVCQLPLHRR